MTSRIERPGTTQYQYDKIMKTISNVNSTSDIIFLSESDVQSLSLRSEKINEYDELSIDKSKWAHRVDQFTIIDNLNAEVLATVSILKHILHIDFGVPFTFENINEPENEKLLKDIFLIISGQSKRNMDFKKYFKFKVDVLRYSYIF